MNNLQKYYQENVMPKLKKQFGITNSMAVPTIKKVVLNVGVGKGLKDKDFIDNVVSTLQRITGQRPVLTKARKSIAAFKIREGMIVGVKVTLRGRRMWDFVEKLTKVTFPRIRDFRGISLKGFDGHGNFAVGFQEYIAFPEIMPDEVEQLHGLEISITTTAENNEQGIALLTMLGFPFNKDIK